ncbi:MAG: tripartite tricarboxylate transporter TctB family protein [Pseudomonadota bacterium]
MRKADLIMALAMGIFSIYLMWKSAELEIGWIDEEGPGGGAFPFWLSAGMLLCCIWIIVRWVRRETEVSRSLEPFMEAGAFRLVAVVVIALTTMVGLTHWIGMYLSIPLFLLFYLRVLGRHSWLQTLSTALLAPVVTFLFFEIALRKTLPKGITEEWFYPLYDIFM